MTNPRSTLMALLLVAGLSPASRAAEPVVAVAVAPLAQIVTRLAGDAVQVVTVVPAGADVETFSPSAQQIAALERARLVVRVGHRAFPLEGRLIDPWLARRGGVVTVSLADHARQLAASSPGAAYPSGTDDPHLWVSPRIVRGAAAELADRLERLLPDEAAAIRRRSVVLQSELAALDARLAARLGGRGGRFLIDHPSLGYLAADYGLEQVAIEREGKEPTPAQLARLITETRRDRFRIVIVQRNVARRAAEVLARETGAELVEIDPLATDWLANTERIGDVLARALVRD